MSIKNIVETYNKIASMELSDAVTSTDMISRTSEISEELAADANIAEKILLSSISEPDLVKFILMVQKIVVVESAAAGNISVLKADMANELQAYTQAVIFATIGALIQEEIL